MAMNTVQEFETRAREAEGSTAPTFLKLGRGIAYFLYAVVLAVVVILVFAFALRLLGASTDAAFTRWIYRSSESAMRPFRGIFPVKEVGDASVLDASLLFGAIAYLALATGLDAVYRGASDRLTRRQLEIARARAEADSVRLQFEALQAQVQYAAAAAAAAQPPHA